MQDLDENLDLLDLEDEADLDNFAESNPFSNPRPKKPWLLLGLGLLVIMLATYIIIRSVGSDLNSSAIIDLDAPTVIETGTDDLQNPVTAPIIIPSQDDKKVEVIKENDKSGVPARSVEDRKDVKFNPNKASVKPVVKVKPKASAPIVKPKPLPEKKKAQKSVKSQYGATPVAKPIVKSSVKAGGWYVQFGSYSTQALAQRAQKKIRSGHTGLFQDKQFVILAAVLPNGKTTYRLRIAFPKSDTANGFCRNAKSDGLECYVAR